MATLIKEEPGCEDEETIMSHVTIKNEPGISWNMDDDACQGHIIKSESEQHPNEIKTESDHGMADWKSQLMITDVWTVSPTEDNVSELKINVPIENVTSDSLQDHGQNTLVNLAKENELSSVTNNAQNVDSRIQTEKRLYKCKACSKCFTTKKCLQKHTGEAPYKYQECGTSFADSRHFVRHKQANTGEKSYKCSVCEKSFARRDQLTRHNLMHTGGKPYNRHSQIVRFVGFYRYI